MKTVNIFWVFKTVALSIGALLLARGWSYCQDTMLKLLFLNMISDWFVAMLPANQMLYNIFYS